MLSRWKKEKESNYKDASSSSNTSFAKSDTTIRINSPGKDPELIVDVCNVPLRSLVEKKVAVSVDVY